MIKILFVCMGNICRSPTAEGVFRQLVKNVGLQAKIHIDSAGTHGYHVGETPDKRAQAAAKKRKIDISHHVARQVHRADFDQHDYILAMDRYNYEMLYRLCPPEHHPKIHLLMDFAPTAPQREVPDPYYERDSGFEDVLDLVSMAGHGLLKHVQQQYLIQ